MARVVRGNMARACATWGQQWVGSTMGWCARTHDGGDAKLGEQQQVLNGNGELEMAFSASQVLDSRWSAWQRCLRCRWNSSWAAVVFVT